MRGHPIEADAVLKRKPGIAPPAWYAAAAAGAVLAAGIALVLGLRAPSDIAPAVVLALRTAPATPSSRPDTWGSAAATAERAGPSCGAADCPAEPVPVRRDAPAAIDVAAIAQPADPDAWALEPRPLGMALTDASAPRATLHNTPWAALAGATPEVAEEGDEAQGGGFEE